jgi:hypothetical protein
MVILDPMPQNPFLIQPIELPQEDVVKTEQIYKQLCQQFWGGAIQPLDASWQKRFTVYQAWSHANCQKEEFENKVAPGDHSSWIMESGQLLLINKKEDAFEIVNWHTGELHTIDKGNYRPALCATAINSTYFICHNQKEIAFFDRHSGQLLDTLNHRSHHPFVIACNDHFLASVNEDKDSVTIWDVHTRQLYWSIEAVLRKSIWTLKISEKYLAIQYENCRAIYVSDLEKKCTHKIEHGFEGFFPAEFAIHADQLAAIDQRSGKIKVWDLQQLGEPYQEFESISPLIGCEDYKHMGRMCHPMDAFLITSGYFIGPNSEHSIIEIIEMRTKQIILKQKIEANIHKIFVQDNQMTLVLAKGIIIYNFEKLHTHFYLADCLKDETLGEEIEAQPEPEMDVATDNSLAMPATPPVKEIQEEKEQVTKIEIPAKIAESPFSPPIVVTPIKICPELPKQPQLWKRILLVAQKILAFFLQKLHCLHVWRWKVLKIV